MDTGLKNFWARRKSKGNGSRQDSGVSSVRESQSQSTEQTHHSASTSPRSIHVYNVLTGPAKSLLSPTASTRAQLTSSGYGGSRPSTSRSRPATDGSGSMLNAVNRAADAVVRAGREYQSSAGRYSKGHIRPKTPRYVDIFSLSSSNSPNPRPGYNEDVAERNLDLARVALEGSHNHYVPSSKYQEEVAARNAHPSLTGSPAISPSVPQGGVIDGNQSPGQGLSVATALSNYPRSPQRLEDRPFSRQSHHTHDSTGLHSRQQSDRSAQSPRRFHESNPPANAAHEVPADALTSYQLSPTEETQLRSTDTPALSKSHDALRRSPSNLSNPSAAKRAINLPNRTIMDLTGDDPDDLAERSPPSDYSSAPVLEHAKSDTARSIQGPVMSDTSTERTQTQSNPSPSAAIPPASTAVSILADVSQHRAPPEEPVSEPSGPGVSTRAARVTSSFTPIITIASASPRTSVEMDKLVAPTAVPDPEQNQNAEDSREQDVLRLATEPAQLSSDRLSEEQSKTTEKSVPLSNTDSSSESVLVTGVGGDVRSKEMETSSDQMANLALGLEPIPADGPYIHLSSETLGHASGTSGVYTRDFANAATKTTLSSVPEDTASTGDDPVTSLVIQTSPIKSSSHKARANRQTRNVPAYKSTFDEEEFVQKQAEAREALIRLQLSLNEDFLGQSAPAPVVRSTRSSPSKHIYSFSDGKPAAPSSIFAHFKESSPTEADAQVTLDSSARAECAEPSYHHLTTVRQDHSLLNGREESSTRSRGTAGNEREKGKQSLEILNGPGPSIVNDAPKQPLPAPLQFTDHLFHHRFSQPVVPPSPGEISLSNFPIPVSSPRQSVQRPSVTASGERERSTRPASQDAIQHPSSGSTPGPRDRILRRKSSAKSQSSSTSVYSIPFHMIPDRSSSVRDRSVMEDDDE